MNIIKIIRLAIASVILTHAQQLVKLSNWFSKGLIDQQKIDNQKLSQALRVVRERMEEDEEFAEKVFETFSSYEAEKFMMLGHLHQVPIEENNDERA